jgi:integrase
VSAATREKYSEAFEEFREWSLRRGRPVLKLRGNVDLIDNLVVAYMNELFTNGEATHTAQTALFGIIFCLGLGKGAQTLPRSRRALQGFRRDEPNVSEDPMPLEIAAVVAEKLAMAPDLVSHLSALALIIQFDLFTRPSETLEIRAQDIVEAKGGDYKGIAVVIAPSTTAAVRQAACFASSAATVRRKRTAVFRRPAAKPAKSGEYDDTIKANLLFPWTGDLLKAMKAACAPQQHIFDPLTLALYESRIRDVMEQLGLEALHLTPHSARHGGASTSMEKGLLDAKGVQKRGRWLAPRSVRRYEKSGKLLRVVEACGPDVINNGSELVKSTGKSSLGFLLKLTVGKIRAARKSIIHKG